MLNHWGRNRESSSQGYVTDHRGEGDTKKKITESTNWRETAYIPRRRSHHRQRQGLPASKTPLIPVSLSRAHPGERVAHRKTRHPETHRVPKKFTQPEKPETAKQPEDRDSNLTFASHEVLASTPWWYYQMGFRSSTGVSRPKVGGISRSSTVNQGISVLKLVIDMETVADVVDRADGANHQNT